MNNSDPRAHQPKPGPGNTGKAGKVASQAPAPWRKLRHASIVDLTADRPGKWHWHTDFRPNRSKIQLISAHGTYWDYKLSGGSWIRRATDE